MPQNNPISVVIEITNQTLCDGVTFAMDRYNADLPEKVAAINDDGTPRVGEDGAVVMIDNPARITNEADYLRWAGAQTVRSYARLKVQYDFDEGTIGKAQRDAALAALA